jgi:hypothetical protein
MLIACEVLIGHRGINTDHLSILTELSLEVTFHKQELILNFREVDWEEFHKVLDKHLLLTLPKEPITDQNLLDQHCIELTRALQEMIYNIISTSDPAPNCKHWWTKKLMQLWKLANKLSRKSFRL